MLKAYKENCRRRACSVKGIYSICAMAMEAKAACSITTPFGLPVVLEVKTA
jgi:hypothetical protein